MVKFRVLIKMLVTLVQNTAFFGHGIEFAVLGRRSINLSKTHKFIVIKYRVPVGQNTAFFGHGLEFAVLGRRPINLSETHKFIVIKYRVPVSQILQFVYKQLNISSPINVFVPY